MTDSQLQKRCGSSLRHMNRHQHPLPSGKLNYNGSTGILFIGIYFHSRIAWGKEAARREAWPFMMWIADTSRKFFLLAPRSDGLCFPELLPPPRRLRQSPAELRALARKKPLHFKACPHLYRRHRCYLSDGLMGELEIRVCPSTINLCKAKHHLGA